MAFTEAAKPASARPLNRLRNVALGKIDSAESRPHERRTQAPPPPPRADRRRARRALRCPACAHQGSVPSDVPMTAKLRCVACGTTALVRQCIGARQARYHHRRPEHRAKDAAAADVLARYGSADLDDPLDDLFQDGGGS